MKVVLTNCWQASNTGDIAIWKNLMKYLSQAFPNIEFLIASQVLIDWDINQLLKYKVKFYLNKLDIAIQDADVVISQGGGYMIGNEMLPYLKAFDIAQRLGKPTFFSTQTFVGPINDEVKLLLKKVLNKALVVTVREQESYDLLIQAGVNRKKIDIAYDTVFDIGIKDYFFPFVNTIKFAIRGYLINTVYLKEIAKLADMITETMGQVVFIPIGHCQERDDIKIAEEITSYMNHNGKVISDKLTAEEIKSILKDGILISDRYHGIVYAISMLTPFLALSPDIDFKMPGLLKSLNYPIKQIWDKTTFNAEKVFPYVFDVWKNKVVYKKLLKEKLPQIKNNSIKVYSKIIEGIKNANIT